MLEDKGCDWRHVTNPTRLPTIMTSQQMKWTYQKHTPPGALKQCSCIHFTAPNLPSIILSSPHVRQIFISLSVLHLSHSLHCGTFSPVNPLMLINGGLLCTWHSVDEASTWTTTASEILPTSCAPPHQSPLPPCLTWNLVSFSTLCSYIRKVTSQSTPHLGLTLSTARDIFKGSHATNKLSRLKPEQSDAYMYHPLYHYQRII
jgi:hypothetical protein